MVTNDFERKGFEARYSFEYEEGETRISVYLGDCFAAWFWSRPRNRNGVRILEINAYRIRLPGMTTDELKVLDAWLRDQDEFASAGFDIVERWPTEREPLALAA